MSHILRCKVVKCFKKFNNTIEKKFKKKKTKEKETSQTTVFRKNKKKIYTCPRPSTLVSKEIHLLLILYI